MASRVGLTGPSLNFAKKRELRGGSLPSGTDGPRHHITIRQIPDGWGDMTKKQNDQKPEEALGQQALEVRWLLYPVSFIGTGARRHQTSRRPKKEK